jgi:hypothetical protein
MKATQTHRIIAMLILAFSFVGLFAQEGRTCTVVEVSGNGYTDKVWLFSVAGTTEGFDNGWDGYKFISNTPAPQIYATSPDGKFQVSTSANIHQQVLGFIPGEAETYTMTFTHTDLNLTYKSLYIHDKVTGKTTDIFAQGATYTFSAKSNDIKDRFVMLTVATNENNAKNENAKERSTKENKAKKVKVFSNNHILSVSNPNTEKAIVRIFNAQNGTFVTEQTIQAESNLLIDSNNETGAFVVAISVENDIYNSTILLQ